MSALRLVVCLVILSINISSGSRIFCFYVVPSYSHQIVYNELTKNLLDRGHELVVATPIPSGYNHTNLTEVDLSSSIQIWKDMADFNGVKYKKKPSHGELVDLFAHIVSAIVKHGLSVPEVQHVIHEEKFDLLIVEYGIYPALYYLKHFMNIPMVGVLSMDATPFGHDDVGQFFHPYQYAESHSGSRFVPTSLVDKMIVTYEYYRMWYMYKELCLPMQAETIRELIDPHFLYYDQYDLTPDALLVNAHPVIGFARPTMPTFVDITGIHLQKPKPLPDEIKHYIEGSEEGIIVFSLGSNVRSELLPKQVIQSFLDAFSMTPYRVLWKWESDESTSHADNIRTHKWLPQTDILRHPKTKLFIFQGGYQSMIEAITYGVPMIAIPFLGDQHLNSDKIHYYKIGTKMKLDQIDKHSLKDTIMELTTNKMYKENVMRMSKELYDAPMTPSERAVWWTEYVIRHNGTKHLRYTIKNKLNIAEYLYLDIITFVLGLIIICIFIIKYILQYIFSNKVEHSKKE